MDLDTLSRGEYIEVLRKDYFYDKTEKFELEQRVVLIEKIMSYLKLTPNREQVAYLLCNRPRVLTEACAGAGKTTISILRSIMMGMFQDTNPETTIMLTYTKKASKDLEAKIAELDNKLSAIDFKGIELNCNVRIMTLHSFFYELIYEYSDDLGIKVFKGGPEERDKMNIFSKGQTLGFMLDIVNAMSARGTLGIKPYQSMPRQLHALYSQIKEKDVYDKKEEWCKCSSFKEVGQLSVTALAEAFDVYEKMKSAAKGVELTEFANKAQLLLANPIILKRWRKLYTNYLVDEFQDVTEAQSKCLQMIVNGSEGIHFAAIGDGDQSIYGFRGAHSNGCYNFPKEYSTGNSDDMAICYMSLNRRCPSEVLEYSRKIIETLNVRNPKSLKSNKAGGSFNLVKVENYEEEAAFIHKELSKMESSDTQDTVIAYRSKKSARLIKDYLQSRKIKCKVEDLFDDLFETTLANCYSMLANPGSMDLARFHLYKMLPKSTQYNKDTITKVIKKEEQSRKDYNKPKYFYQLDWSMGNDPSFPSPPENFYREIDMLKRISLCITEAVDATNFKNPNIVYMSYLTAVIMHNYIKKYYLNWQDKKISTEGTENIFDGQGQILDEYCRRVYDRYSQKITYKEFLRQEAQRKEGIENSSKVVNLSTFHSLKGLEFKNVYLIDMRDNVFPGYELMLAGEFGPSFIKEADDEAKRLLYVAMTRAKQNLTIVSRKVNPFRYESYLSEEKPDYNSAMVQEIETFSTNEFGDFSMDEVDEEEEIEDIVEGTEQEVEQESGGSASTFFNRSTSFDRWMKK